MQTEKLICSSLLALMRKKPYDKIKVSELVDYAGISRSSFYFYFNSVNAALDKIENDFIHGISDENSAILRIINSKRKHEDYETLIRPTVEFVKNNLYIFFILSGSNGNPDFQTKLTLRIYTIYNVLYSNSALSETEKALTCELMASAQWAIYKWWAQNEKSVNAEDIIKYISKMLYGLQVFF